MPAAANHPPPDEGGILRSSHPAGGCSMVASDVDGGEDLISRLPDKLLADVVARLPLKDAARTAVLSPRWRRVWASTPLVLDDAAGLLPELSDGLAPANWRDTTDAVSRILAAHPGPFLSVRLTRIFHYAVAHDPELASRWLRVLADKTVESLRLFNLPGATSAGLPSEVLSIASVRRLYLGHWDFPSTDALCRGTEIFPKLRELWLRQMHMGAADFDRLLLFTPALEIFALVSSHSKPPNVRIRSRNLKCAIFWMSVASQFHLLVTQRLNRLILWSKNADGRSGSPTKVSIGYVPELRVLGYLDPRQHVLEIGTTLIEAETKPTLATMVPSVQVLALNVRFDVSSEAKMVPSFLRCFPCIHTLHVQSDGVGESNGELNVKFWLEGGPIRCLRSTVTKVVFKNFRGHDTELTFLRFIWERAKVLKKLVVDFAGRDDPAVLKQVFKKMRSKVFAKVFPDRRSKLMLRTGGGKLSLTRASDLSLSDPFDF